MKAIGCELHQISLGADYLMMMKGAALKSQDKHLHSWKEKSIYDLEWKRRWDDCNKPKYIVFLDDPRAFYCFRYLFDRILSKCQRSWRFINKIWKINLKDWRDWLVISDCDWVSERNCNIKNLPLPCFISGRKCK